MKQPLTIFVISFIAIIMGIILLQTLADQNAKANDLTTANATVTSTAATGCFKVVTGCIERITAISNATGTLATTNYSTTPCVSSGSANRDGITLMTPGISSYNVTAQYSGDCTYVNSTTSRTLLGVIILLFAIAVMVVGVWAVKESGLFDQL
jgi:uncharacterized membrane protein YidH (DUF202 family)